jgi:hypothetical protein
VGKEIKVAKIAIGLKDHRAIGGFPTCTRSFLIGRTDSKFKLLLGEARERVSVPRE